MPASEFHFGGADGAQRLGRRWTPDGTPRAVVQIAHGLAEHSARYARLAGALNVAGFAAYASDHRGHGPACAADDLGHFADRNGWAACVADLWTFNRLIAAENPGVPIALLGHSMGSFLARSFATKHSDALAGLVLSGSSGKAPAIAAAGRFVARGERLRLGVRGTSPLLVQMMFGAFNKPFEPARTPFDWLSRDPAEVDKYVADPACGFPFSTQLAIDLLDALPGLSAPASLAPIRKDLPIYIFSGEKDPVGANIQSLIDAYKAAGFSRVTSRIYPGARHETLNETNRDEVTRDLVAWLNGVVGA
jgi:alpha-beta hydrolase superfamily lysophospholipase